MKTKKTPKIERIVNQLVSRLQGKGCVQVRRELKKMGYVVQGSGTFKIVYRRADEPVCVKVYKSKNGWQEDSFNVPNIIRKHYLYPIYKSKVFHIQEWVPTCIDDSNLYGSALAKEYRRLKVKRLPKHIRYKHDVSGDNVRILNGKEVIVDFCYNAT